MIANALSKKKTSLKHLVSSLSQVLSPLAPGLNLFNAVKSKKKKKREKRKAFLLKSWIVWIWKGNIGRLTWHGWCSHCTRIYWSVICVIFSAKRRYDALFTLCGTSNLHEDRFVLSHVRFLCLELVFFFFSLTSPLTYTYALFFHVSCTQMQKYMHACSLCLTLCVFPCLSASSGVSWFHSFQSVCLATGIFADVSVRQPQWLREML